MNEQDYKLAKRYLDGLNQAIKYERDRGKLIKNEDYVGIINAVLDNPTKITNCSNCSGVMLNNHNKFIQQLWQRLYKIHTIFVPPMPVFKSGKYRSEMWSNTIKCLSFTDLMNQKNLCNNEAKRYQFSKNNMLADSFLNDAKAFQDYYTIKMGYFEHYYQSIEDKVNAIFNLNVETKQDIAIEFNVEEVVKALNLGMTIKQAAKYFKVTQKAIQSKIKENNIKISKDLIETAAENAKPKTSKQALFIDYVNDMTVEEMAIKYNIDVESVLNVIKDVIRGEIDGPLDYDKIIVE